MANNLKNYDGFQVLRSVFDVANNCLRVCIVSGGGGGGGGDLEIVIDHTNDSIRLGNGTDFLTTTSPSSGIVALDVAVKNEVNIRPLTASDTISISDGSNTLSINTDGSINTNIQPSPNFISTNKYGEITSLASSTENTIISHVAAGGRTTYVQQVLGSAENIAEFRVKINGVVVDKQRTNHGSAMSVMFKYEGYLNPGYLIEVGDLFELTAIHLRPTVGNFNGRITLLEIL